MTTLSNSDYSKAVHQLLGIPPEEQPPHYYRLLGVALFENDPVVLRRQYDMRARTLQQLAGTELSAVAAKLMEDLSRAKLCLLDAEQKRRYDDSLRRQTPAPEDFEPICTWIVGSAAGCDLVVAQPEVSRMHCKLIRQAGKFFLQDLDSTNGTFVQGKRLRGRTEIAAGTPVRLGQNSAMPWPELVTNPRVVTIGRSADNQVVLEHPTVSAHHARLYCGPREFVLEDLGSRNGTALSNPDRKIRNCRIEAGDRVYLGRLEIAAEELIRLAQAVRPPQA